MTNINTNFLSNVSSSVKSMCSKKLPISSSLDKDIETSGESKAVGAKNVDSDSQNRSPYLTFGDLSIKVTLNMKGKHVYKSMYNMWQ